MCRRDSDGRDADAETLNEGVRLGFPEAQASGPKPQAPKPSVSPWPPLLHLAFTGGTQFLQLLLLFRRQYLH